ncbi:MAG: hypothetical protein J1E35_04075 [Lachnospiraceae bacterium]|nr:hypothetical protein [Lachnospiraceae bacterium]
MVVLITAIAPEAAAAVSALSLKKAVSKGTFTLYENEDDALRLLVTGAGKLNAAIAVTEYLSLYSFSDTDIFCNLGICGTNAALPKGLGFLCVSIDDPASGKTIYPEVYGHPFREAFLSTFDTPVTAQADPVAPDSCETLPRLFDMEAYGVAAALFRQIPPSHCFFYKVISDFCDGSFPSAEETTLLLQPHISALLAFLRDFLQEKEASFSGQNTRLSPLAKEAAENLLGLYPFSASMKHRFMQLLTYAGLSGIEPEELLSSYVDAVKPHKCGAISYGTKKQALALLRELERFLLNPADSRDIDAFRTKKKHLRPFRHIYVERDVLEHPVTKRILERFSDASVIPVTHYKNIFNRSRQNLFMQETEPAFILAANRGNLFYPGAPVCQSFGEEYFMYTSCIMNCIYDCDYCYLQGMYPSGNIVVFVNLEDYFTELDSLLSKHPVYLCCSYDSDLTALNGLFPHAEEFCRYAAKHPRLRLELRTKCAALPFIKKLPPAKNIVLAFTLSPQELITRYEHFTPSLNARLTAAKEAAKRGFSLRLCFDPLLDVPNAEHLYTTMIEQTFFVLTPEEITDISIGVFRLSKDYLKQLRKAKPSCALSFYPYELTGGVFHYPAERCAGLLNTVQTALRRHNVPDEKIFIWTPDESGKGDYHA